MASVAPGARIMPIKALDSENRGTTTNLTDGVRYATRMGVDVINISAAGDGDDPDLTSAIIDARKAGVIVITGAGNDGHDLASASVFPAESDGAIAVAATDFQGDKAVWSNYGGPVELAAPGEDVETLSRGGGKTQVSGTSFAAPGGGRCRRAARRRGA